MYELKTFGGLRLASPEGAPALSRRRLSLLAVLAAAGDRGVSRDRLIAWFWEDAPEASARHSLEQLLSSTRVRLGAALFAGTDPLRLDPAVIRTDVAAFEQALASGDLEAAAALYEAPFLDGFRPDGGAELEHWLDRERERLAERHREALTTLARAAEEAGDHAAAAHWWRRAAAADPYAATPVVALMQALAAGGDIPAAILAGRAHERLVREELELAPDPSVTALCRELEQRLAAAPVPEAPAPTPAAAEAPPAPSLPVGPVEAAGPMQAPVPAPALSRRRAVLAAAAVAALLLAGATAVARRSPPRPSAAAALERVQLTFTGNARMPSLSPDESRIAFATQVCDSATPCHWAVVVQDVDGAGAATIASGFEWLYWRVQWSWDGRFVLVHGGRSADEWGMYAIPSIGGQPRYLGCCGGRPDRTGDTILITGWIGRDRDANAIRVVTISDGVVHDSLRVRDHRPGAVASATRRSPDGRRFTMVRNYLDSVGLSVFDRTGRAGPETLLPFYSRVADWTSDGKALLVHVPAAGGMDLLRYPVRGVEVSAQPDTLIRGLPAVDDLELGPRGSLVYSAGPLEHRVWALRPAARARALRFAARRIATTTAPPRAAPSPDGSRIAVAGRIGGTRALHSVSVVDAVSGEPLGVAGAPVAGLQDVGWSWDGGALWLLRREGERAVVEERSPDGVVLRVVHELPVGPDGAVLALPDGGGAVLWFGSNRLARFGVPGVPDTLLPVPDWFAILAGWSVTADGRRLLVAGMDRRRDSSIVASVDVATGRWSVITGIRRPLAGAPWEAPDGSVLVAADEGGGARRWYRLRAGREPERGELAPFPNAQYRFARSGGAALATEATYRTDVYLVRGFAGMVGR